MKKKVISIIYAHRNRDAKRIRLSLESLVKQNLQNFEVIFIDFGSEDSIVNELEMLSRDFSFVSFYHLPVAKVLWNKSKALNYGINKASGEYIFIADIDLIFHPNACQLLKEIADSKKYFLFKLGYLGRHECINLQGEYNFNDLKPSKYGEVNGMILTSRESLIAINGLDEFFHFYGAEDEDLFSRLETAGYHRMYRDESYFYHQWHQSFPGSEDKLLTGNPRMKNIMRINQRHFKFNQDLRTVRPLKQAEMGQFINEEISLRLKSPTLNFHIPNIQAYVEHFLREELPYHKGQIIKVIFSEDSYSTSVKHFIKKRLGKQTQAYISMKEVNDMVLKEILYNYRDHNYWYKVENDLKNIDFRLEL